LVINYLHSECKFPAGRVNASVTGLLRGGTVGSLLLLSRLVVWQAWLSFGAVIEGAQ
jgi:hypothetical protein